jgi:hypothetical protein
MKITILSPVDHDGKQLEVGETYNVPDRAAGALVVAGAAEPAGKAKVAPAVEAEQLVTQAVAAPAPGETAATDQGGQQ